MTLKVRRSWIALGAPAVLMLLAGYVVAQGQSGPAKPASTNWSDYAGSADSMQYSALKQINKNNVSQLDQAWFFPTPGPSVAFNPVIVDGVMYVLGNRTILAVDAITGKQIWSHPVEGSPPDRGINYWESKNRSDRRLIFAAGSFLQ